MLEIVTIAALTDNYDFLVHDPASGHTAVVDAADPAPILDALTERGWTLDEIWLTHHHWDHVEGTAGLVEATGATVTGAKADQHRLPPLTRVVEPGQSFTFAGHEVEVLAADGHTVGHIAYYIPSSKALFTADSLMALGCGRLFEGTPEQMWETLSRFAALPDDTVIYSGHEYTASNARFARTIEPENTALQARAQAIEIARQNDEPTIPSLLSVERATNPFLRANLPEVKEALGMADASDVEVFAEIRARKDSF
ncbi:hydroxyacylglutathione hydrolase [Celeribacter halophilus]|uniref:Hydroxyacylglutathione hydrolase n=1 Tax=Celeribacter halophilus TaxID=576117 RepID=A0AAW7XSD2_9RHOB|nr:hydroxyacylglutathione hydrolase [Celeribacter halophilus]MDO6457184.1 hydroxyacylglutathione hydrolase [Celeribacter halophilus]MDO6723726.1 hydroxyacylglutathione hydrolase [Celeribacter halophilus]